MNNHFDTPATLRTITRTQDANGYPVESQTTSLVWGDVRSATRTEFYSAEAQGHKVAMILTVPVLDYDGAEEVTIDNKTFKVVRVYQKSLDLIELSLERI